MIPRQGRIWHKVFTTTTRPQKTQKHVNSDFGETAQTSIFDPKTQKNNPKHVNFPF